MTAAVPLTPTGSVFLDPRGGERALRVSWHTDRDLVVLSLWRANVCAASFRIDADDVPALIEVLASGLAEISEQRVRVERSVAARDAHDDTAERPAVAVGETMPIRGPVRGPIAGVGP